RVKLCNGKRQRHNETPAHAQEIAQAQGSGRDADLWGRKAMSTESFNDSHPARCWERRRNPRLVDQFSKLHFASAGPCTFRSHHYAHLVVIENLHIEFTCQLALRWP